MQTYEKRLSKITSIQDADHQIELAKKTATRLGRLNRSFTENVESREELKNSKIHANSVLRKLRMAVFDIEDFFTEGPATHKTKCGILLKKSTWSDNQYIRIDKKVMKYNDDQVVELDNNIRHYNNNLLLLA